MLGKIIDGVLTYPPNRIILNGMQIFNPTQEQLMQVGWKTVTETPIPEDPASEGQHYEATYEDKGDYIEQVWELAETVPEEPVGKALGERVTGLEQAVQSVEDAIERGLGV